MPAPNRAFWNPGLAIAVVVAVLSLAGCARMSPVPSSRAPAPARAQVGHISGHIEQGAAKVAVIHLEAIGESVSNSRAADQARVSIEQGRQQPRIVVVRPDQPLRVANLDSIHHDIFSVESENPFRAHLASGEESESVILRTPGFVRAYCRLHPNESYAFLVTDAARIAYLEGDSAFEISGVPVGEYLIRATDLDGESESARVQVTADRTLELTLRLLPRAAR